ncbi:Kinesin-related motor protein [Oleoguttula sp. CCFEE 5521]
MAAPASQRPMLGMSTSRKVSTMRPPTARPPPNRAQTATPTLTGRASSPTESLASSRSRTPKRKAENDMAVEETNINVVVRCRGRNDREVRENSGVVVSTDGIKGKKVDLSMGPTALSNKTYQFDKVFSPAADQGMIFDEVVTPILDEVLAGFNCTIFAYGQTGTGKTYTMSGDITDILPIPEAAGIVPRVLQTLFAKLGEDENDKSENSVKCSFIELYNEELRDLLSADDTTKLKIFDEANKTGRSTTMVQGMEEAHIKTASKGIQLLREGSHKRQVAATKCNDLSSRSHTVFTVTVYMKRTSETGEDFVSAGKLNLVDLAGSENIQRSGAENKRAAEAGLINKSLLTLGRVINALVDKSSHIPYRESKLTRLLQDSLGGQTKTCIIATLSPAKSNLEETISTLDYAFRAKNIRNKPQINQTVSKKTLLKEFTAEIEKLKSELIATRQRNGVYLTAESYEELTTESESRRILSEEQRDKIETMEANLRNKVQDLFILTTNFQSMKRDNEQTRMLLEGTKSILDKTEVVLAHTRKTLAEESHLRKAHQETEGKLLNIGEDLVGQLGTTTDHISRLHSKLRRRSDLQSTNREKWAESQTLVSDTTLTVESRIDVLRSQQETLLSGLSSRMQSFVSDELQQLSTSQSFLQEKAAAFTASEQDVNIQTAQSREDMNTVLQEIKTLREDVKQKVGDGLNDVSNAAQRISAGIATELTTFHAQLQTSYVSLGREFKTIFEDLIKRMHEQQSEVRRLREQMATANDTLASANTSSQSELEQAIQQEREIASAERAELLSKVTDLITASARTQDDRVAGYVESANKRLKTSSGVFQSSRQAYNTSMDAWNTNATALVDSSVKNRDTIKSKLKQDWTAANDCTARITKTTNAVHSETVRIVDDQMAQMDSQLHALDEIVSRVKTQNDVHHEAHTASIAHLASNVQESYASIGTHFQSSFERVKTLETGMHDQTGEMLQTLPALNAASDIRAPLQDLRNTFTVAKIAEYQATGETPAKTSYSYPTVLPRTEPPETLLARLRGEDAQQPHSISPSKRSPSKLARSSPSKAQSSPSKTQIFTDTPPTLSLPAPSSAPSTRPATASSLPSSTTLREVDVNITLPALPSSVAAAKTDDGAKTGVFDGKNPTVVRIQRVASANVVSTLQAGGQESRLPGMAKRKTVAGTMADGRENEKPGIRKLRSRGSD